jgi:hypothetical protein
MNNKKNEEVKYTFWAVIGFIVLAFIVYFTFFDNSQEYKDCVNSCVSDNLDCISFISPLSDKNGEEYLVLFEVESCADELEDCISFCE